MYVCGVTVYDDCHLGHARSALTFDIIRRYFEYSGYKVIYVRNFTDIDDKILHRAQKEGVTWQDISERYIQAFYRDMGALGISRPHVEPRALFSGCRCGFFRVKIPNLLPIVRQKSGGTAGRSTDRG